MTSPEPLFVYGTLMEGQSSAGILGQRQRVAATTRGRLYHLPAGYPALTLEGEERVHGELVAEVDARLLGLLDTYEGVSEGLYERQYITVTVGLRNVRAWAYVMKAPTLRGGVPVRGGRWRPVRRR